MERGELDITDKEKVVEEARPGQKPLAVGDLIRQCQAAASNMAVGNSHRLLLVNCGTALAQLVDRIEYLEKPRGGVN